MMPTSGEWQRWRDWVSRSSLTLYQKLALSIRLVALRKKKLPNDWKKEGA